MKKNILFFSGICAIIFLCSSSVFPEDTKALKPAAQKNQITEPSSQAIDADEVVIKQGETLWSISGKYLNDPNKWIYIAKYNNLTNPDVLSANTKIKIPKGDLAKLMPDVQPVSSSAVSAASSKSTVSKKQNSQTSKKSQSKDQQDIKVKPDVSVLSAAEIQRKQIEELYKEISVFETQFTDLVSRDSMIKNQKEYFQVSKAIEEARGELSLGHLAVSKELLEKAKIISEKIKINVQVETMILKTVKLTEFKGKIDIYFLKDQMWVPAVAAVDRSLRNGDKIRAGSLSGAVLAFEDGSQLIVRSNSEIEIKRSIFDIKNNTLYSRIALLRGYIQYKSLENLPIKTVNELECLDSFSEFYGNLAATVFQDNTIKYELYSGMANIISRNEKRTLQNGFGLYIFPGASPSAPSQLLNPVQLFSPANNVYSKTSTPELSWGSGAGAENYLIQIAEDEYFHKIVYEETARQTKKKSTALLDGKYYWRVIPIDKNGFYGFVKESRMFLIDTIAPRLALLSPKEDEIINEKYVIFHGMTEPGRNVKINNFTILPDKNGEFKYSIPLMQGTNIVRLEASDNAGNITTLYRLFHIDYDLQLVHYNNRVYSTIPSWNISTYYSDGEVIFNSQVFDVKQGEWKQPLTMEKGMNNMTIGISRMPYKEIKFVYDNEKPELKSLRISPEVNGDNATLTFYLKVNDSNSPLERNAKIILFEKNDPSSRYEIELVYNQSSEEYYGKLEAPRKIITKELILGYASVSDIAGNTAYLSEDAVYYPGQPTLFWDKIKTNYKQLGLPMFVISMGGILFAL